MSTASICFLTLTGGILDSCIFSLLAVGLRQTTGVRKMSKMLYPT